MRQLFWIHFVLVELLPVWLYLYTDISNDASEMTRRAEECFSQEVGNSNATLESIFKTRSCIASNMMYVVLFDELEDWSAMDCAVSFNKTDTCKAHITGLRSDKLADKLEKYLGSWVAQFFKFLLAFAARIARLPTIVFVVYVLRSLYKADNGSFELGSGAYLSFTYELEYQMGYKVYMCFQICALILNGAILILIEFITWLVGRNPAFSTSIFVNNVLQLIAVYKLLFPNPPKFDWTSENFKTTQFARGWSALLFMESNDSFGTKLLEAAWFYSKASDASLDSMLVDKSVEAQASVIKVCSAKLPGRRYRKASWAGFEYDEPYWEKPDGSVMDESSALEEPFLSSPGQQ